MRNKVVHRQSKHITLTGLWITAAVWMGASGLPANLLADDSGATRFLVPDSAAAGKLLSSSTKSDSRVGTQQELSQKTQGSRSAAVPADAETGSGMLLPARGKSRTGPQASKTAPRSSLTNLAISLGLVLAIFFGLVWILRRVNPAATKAEIPGEVVQILGRAPLNGRQSMQLVRLGDKILLLAISPTGTEPLGEITDRDEVDAITEICRSKNKNKIAETFRETLTRVRRDRMTNRQRTVLSRNS